MHFWALAFFIVALLAAFFGFGAVAVAFAAAAKLIFYAAVVLFVISVVGIVMQRV